MKVFIVFAAVLAVTLAQLADESPKPYSFNYVAEGEEGSSSHSETADGSGTVRGSYTLTDIDGRNRVVEYVAGPEGFNANIRTNEPGTDNAAPANVVIESAADAAKPVLNAARPEPKPAQGAGVRYVLVPAN